MSVRILAVYTHPRYCVVCDGHLFVKASRLLPVGQGGTGTVRYARETASRLSVVVPCPQCSGADGLLSLLPRDTGEAS